jgi:hypothetical protein
MKYIVLKQVFLMEKDLPNATITIVYALEDGGDTAVLRVALFRCSWRDSGRSSTGERRFGQ